ncbi:hypothetical protein D9Q98_002469 [Chlorella vulgaris]|uniref:DUF262 domain-containing protein n=1 Tax=Chlorella vulgaris TaxID=3077 RepID=A0A9D4YZD6_CHLVU|nr:hypothetical protein D9Q98_002469 [Chlorella vulgaris]
MDLEGSERSVSEDESVEDAEENGHQETYLAMAPIQGADLNLQKFKAEQISFSKLFSSGGTIFTPDTFCYFVIPDEQRPYEWDEPKATGLLSNLLHLYFQGIQQHTLGDILAWKSDELCVEILVLNGQQRLVTVTLLLALLRLEASRRSLNPNLPDDAKSVMSKLLRKFEIRSLFVFENDAGQQASRILMRQRQRNFWTEYIATNDAQALGRLWGPGDVLQTELAGGDTINLMMMKNLTAMLATLKRNHPFNNKVVADSHIELANFATFMLERVQVSFSLVTGGGAAYRSQVFIHSNWQQMALKDEDLCKAAILESAATRSVEFADVWEDSFFNLKAHLIPCLNDRSAFTHIFHIIREIIIKDYNTRPLVDFFINARNGLAFNLWQHSHSFMDDYFKPVSKALDRIFNWTKIGFSEEQMGVFRNPARIKCLMDRIKTHCRSLVRVLAAVDYKKHRPSMACWLPVAAALFHQLYPDDPLAVPAQAVQAETNVAALAQYLRQLDARMFYFMAAGVHWGRVKNIMVTGGSIRVKGEQLSFPVGALGACCYVGPNNHGRISAMPLQGVEESLALREPECQEVVEYLLKIDYRSRTPQLPRQLLLLYDDELRSPVNGPAQVLQPGNEIDVNNYDLQIRERGCKLQLDHILPQNPGAHKQYWHQLWPTAPRRKFWLNMPGNIALFGNMENQQASNRPFDQKKEFYCTAGSLQFFSTSQLYNFRDWDEEPLMAVALSMALALAMVVMPMMAVVGEVQMMAVGQVLLVILTPNPTIHIVSIAQPPSAQLQTKMRDV